MENTISACLIVKDEEKDLDNCLCSIKDLVDEIIIIDTGSRDKTKEIAKRYTGKIFDFEWTNDFSKARNFSLSKASKDWILSIDADESFSKKDCVRIKECLNKNIDGDAFLINLRTYTNRIGVENWQSSKDDEYAESKCANGFFIVKLLRLWKNYGGFFFEGKIHETPHNSIKNRNGKLCDTDIIMHHFGELNKERLPKKKEQYVKALKERLEKKDITEKSEHFVCFELGKELGNLNKINESIYYFKKAVSMKADPKYLWALGSVYLEEGNLDDAEKILKKADELNPYTSAINNNLGIIYAQRKEFDKAIKKFEITININPKFADGYFNLGLLYLEKGKKNKSKFYLKKAIELNPIYKKRIQFS